MNYRFSPITDCIKTLNTPIKCSIAFLLVFASCQTYATPTGFGTFTRDSNPKDGSVISGEYTTVSGAQGTYQISLGARNGYGSYDFSLGNNGIEIKNEANTGIANDKFTYTFKITPKNNTAIHTIKIGQSTYPAGTDAQIGNSEVARQTLEFSKNSQIDVPAQVFIKKNPKVPYYYEAMGDYFMGERIDSSDDFSYKNTVSEPQLRFNSNSALYFYRFDFLNGTNLGNNRFRPTTNNRNVSIRSGEHGFLPTPANLANILKSSSTNPNNQNTYDPLSSGTIGNGNSASYVSYGVKNADSDYVVAVRNASSVTLTYEGIMNGSNAFIGEKVGETFREWISFGIESEPLYVFSGKVFNDNGGIENANPQDTSIVNNTNYFNGKLDNNELGISAPNLQIRLTDCNNNNIVTAPGTPNPQTVANTNQDRGKYSFSVLPTILANNTTGICVVEEEPQTSSWSYTVDTTPNKLNSNFPTDNYNYTDLNFGEVTQNNSALALKKYQFVHKCDTTLQYESIEPDTSSPLTGFSTEDIGSIDPGMCIAYKIEAHNRGHLALTDIQIMDSLQKKSSDQSRVKSVFQLPESEGIHAGLYKDNNINSGQANIGENGTIISENFALTNTTSSTSSSMKELYFNTKYGTTTTP